MAASQVCNVQAAARAASFHPRQQQPAACSVSHRVTLQKEFSGAQLATSATAVSVSFPSRTERTRRLSVEAAKRVDNGRSLVPNSTLIAEEGKEKEVAQLCKSVLSLAEEKKKEKKSGILSFECHSDAYEGNVVHFWERFDDFVSMNDFHASPEYTKFLEDVRPLLTQPVLLAAYEYNNGQIGCMLNPIGPKGEGGLDDATGQGGSGGGASYKQTSQSVKQGITDRDRDGWGLEQALEMSSSKNAAVEAAAAIAKSFRSIFGGKKK